MNTYTEIIATYIQKITSDINKMNIYGKVSETYRSETEPGFWKSDKYFTTNQTTPPKLTLAKGRIKMIPL